MGWLHQGLSPGLMWGHGSIVDSLAQGGRSSQLALKNTPHRRMMVLGFLCLNLTQVDGTLTVAKTLG